MSAVWADQNIQSRTHLLVLLSIADCANREDGKAWPSIDYLAKKARCSQRSVQDAISSLISQNKLEVEFGLGPSGTNVYRVIVGGVQNLRGADSRTKIRRVFVRPVAPKPSGTVRNQNEPCVPGRNILQQFMTEVGKYYNRKPTDPWAYDEQHAAHEVCKRPDALDEWLEILSFLKKPGSYGRQSIQTLLINWTQELDKARNYDQRNNRNTKQGFDRNKGTFNEGKAKNYDLSTIESNRAARLQNNGGPSPNANAGGG